MPVHRPRITVKPLTGKRLSGESVIAVIACNDWLRLGPRRSLKVLLEQYKEKLRSGELATVPTESEKTLAGCVKKESVSRSSGKLLTLAMFTSHKVYYPK